jgi:hypothetical protein
MEPRQFGRRCGYAALVLALAVGAALRLLWVEDMEYKGDERWTFNRTQAVGRTEPLPWLGMPTSFELRHPGGTVWTFLALGKLFHVRQPTDLGRACQLLNVAALLLLVGFAFVAVPRGEREPWLWAAALAAVNPLAVLLHRKIWPPSVMPAYTMLVLVCWWHRDRRAGAFAWGLAGTLLGFLYPAGLFFALGFAAWAFLFDRAGVRWRPWLAGSCLGVLPLLPWLVYVCAALPVNPIAQRNWIHVCELKFWFRWLTEPFGLSLEYTLGDDFADFLGYPFVAGRPTYLVAALHLALLLAAVGLVGWGAWRLWRQRERLGELWVGRQSATAFTQSAGLWGFGIAFTLSLLPVHRHYMVLTFPLMFLWLARLTLAHRGRLVAGLTSGRLLLLGVWAAQMLISLSFLGYVHANQRAIAGEYGMPYGAARSLESQLPLQRQNPLALPERSW